MSDVRPLPAAQDRTWENSISSMPTPTLKRRGASVRAIDHSPVDQPAWGIKVLAMEHESAQAPAGTRRQAEIVGHVTENRLVSMPRAMATAWMASPHWSHEGPATNAALRATRCDPAAFELTMFEAVSHIWPLVDPAHVLTRMNESGGVVLMSFEAGSKAVCYISSLEWEPYPTNAHRAATQPTQDFWSAFSCLPQAPAAVPVLEAADDAMQAMAAAEEEAERMVEAELDLHRSARRRVRE
jgi:hypothetical protein